MLHETENQTRLRRAKAAVESCQDAEAEARRVLASAIESTRRAREKYSALFLAEENSERAHRIADYRHCTK